MVTGIWNFTGIGVAGMKARILLGDNQRMVAEQRGDQRLFVKDGLLLVAYLADSAYGMAVVAVKHSGRARVCCGEAEEARRKAQKEVTRTTYDGC
jgi:hypothetical protein